MKQTFSKEERLCSKKIIDQLFDIGTSFAIPPIRAIWMESTLYTALPVQVVMVVPKKNIPKASQRNTIKRRMRESYRKNKEILYTPLIKDGKQRALALVYTANQVGSYKEIEEKIILTLHRLVSNSNEHAK